MPTNLPMRRDMYFVMPEGVCAGMACLRIHNLTFQLQVSPSYSEDSGCTGLPQGKGTNS